MESNVLIMKFKTKLVILIVLFFYGCNMHSTKVNPQISKRIHLKSGLHIINGINRGVAFNDALGDRYAITYINTIVTNDSTIPIHFQISFLNEYDFPNPDSNEKYKLILLSKEWAKDDDLDFDNLIAKMPQYKDNHSFSKTIEPNQKIVLPIATYRRVPSKTSVPIPNALFSQNDIRLYKDCSTLMNIDSTTNTQMRLWLKLIVDINSDSPRCIPIVCGQISYPEH